MGLAIVNVRVASPQGSIPVTSKSMFRSTSGVREARVESPTEMEVRHSASLVAELESRSSPQPHHACTELERSPQVRLSCAVSVKVALAPGGRSSKAQVTS